MTPETQSILHKIERSIGRMEGLLEGVAASLEKRETEHNSLATRVTKIERRQAFSAGSTSVLSSIRGAIGGGIIAYFARHFG